MKPDCHDVSRCFPGYRIVRHDRVLRRGGGVALICRDDCLVEVLLSSKENVFPSVDGIAVEFCVMLVSSARFPSLIVIVVYRPPRAEHFSRFLESISEFLSFSPRCVIAGDFNYNLNDPLTDGHLLLEQLHLLDFRTLRFGSTFCHTVGESELDFCAVSGLEVDESSIAKSDFPFPGGHLWISFLVHIVNATARSELPAKRIRDWRGYTDQLLLQSLNACDWTLFGDSYASPDELAELLTGNMQLVLDNLAPFKVVRGSSRVRQPWRTAELDDLEAECSRLHRRYRRKFDYDVLVKFREVRRRSQRLYSVLFSSFIQESLGKCTSVAERWRILDRYGLISVGGDQGSVLDEDEFAKFLLDLPGTSDPVTDLISFVDFWTQSLPVSFHFANFTADMISSEVQRMMKKKSPGYDGIVITHLYDGLPLLAPLLAELFNRIVSTGCFPYIWKKSIIRPIPKKANPSTVADFRPIALQPIIAKLFEGIAFHQLSRFLESSGIFSEFQFGFRRHYSTEMAVVDLLELIRQSMDRNNLTVVVFIDFTVAFNSLFPSHILSTLLGAGLSSASARWIADSFTNRQFAIIKRDGSFTEWYDYSRGFGQGSRGGGLFYNSASADVPRLIHSRCRCRMFADDKTVECDFPPAEMPAAFSAVQESLNAISDWADKAGLCINGNKCKYMVFGSSSGICSIADSKVVLKIGDKQLERVADFKYLGVWLDESLSWRKQVARSVAKVYRALRSISHLRSALNQDARIFLVKSLCSVHLDYCSSAYAALDGRLSSSCQVSLNACIRFITNIPHFQHVSPYRRKLGFLSAVDRRRYFALVLFFKLVNSEFPPALYKTVKLIPHGSFRRGRSASVRNFILPLSHSSSFSKSFSYGTIKDWNSLPDSLKESSSLFAFKRNLRTFLLARELD